MFYSCFIGSVSGLNGLPAETNSNSYINVVLGGTYSVPSSPYALSGVAIIFLLPPSFIVNTASSHAGNTHLFNNNNTLNQL